LTYTAVKNFRFRWIDVADATHYKLLENPDGVSGFTPVGGDIAPGIQAVDHVVPLYRRTNAQYLLQSCNAAGCNHSTIVSVNDALAACIGYLKASNTGAGDGFGGSVSLSADGNTLAVAAVGEDSNATGTNGNQLDDSAASSGSVYVFTRGVSGWSQQAYIKASNTDARDSFGIAVSLSGDGDTLAVGAYQEDSSATGINGNTSNNLAMQSGAVYVYTRVDGNWSQQSYIKASNTGTTAPAEVVAGDIFGLAVSLSADGNTLAVGAPREDSNATGINGAQADNSGLNSGAAYVFVRNNSAWRQQAYLKASNTGGSAAGEIVGDLFGAAVSLSADGNTLAVGAENEDSNATSIDGNQLDNSAASSGAAYIFGRAGENWSQQAYVKASNTGGSSAGQGASGGDRFGGAVSLSADGETLAVGARWEDSSATGINGAQADNSALDSGAVYVFVRNDGAWRQQAYVKASNTAVNYEFGGAVSLSGDGNILAVGAQREQSNATGIDGNQTANAVPFAGAVYLFSRTGVNWSQMAYTKASNTEESDLFGSSVNLAGDGKTLVVGARQESSNATGISGNHADNSSMVAGAVYLY
ncbi:MAG: FG-GAP repeat protein, partial [Gammaproteobacteria bacterium]